MYARNHYQLNKNKFCHRKALGYKIWGFVWRERQCAQKHLLIYTFCVVPQGGDSARFRGTAPG